MIAWPSLELLERAPREESLWDMPCDVCDSSTKGERTARHRDGLWGHVYCILGVNF